MKVWRKNGTEMWFLVYTEVQSQKLTTFTRRTYVVWHRIFEKYEHDTVSLAILADDNPSWRPSRFTRECFGCRLDFTFPYVKLLDYQKKPDDLASSDNIFAIVVQAHLKTLATKNNHQDREREKLQLTKSLYQQGRTKKEIAGLYRFIDWLMKLPKGLLFGTCGLYF